MRLITCKRCKNERNHCAKDLCKNCYAILYWRRKHKEDPESYAKKNRLYREKYPRRFLKIMATSYMRKLTEEERKEILEKL